MSSLINQLEQQGGSPHHGGATDADEQEYDRLRGLAREEAKKRGRCFERSRAAYISGDRAAASALSGEGKKHGAAMNRYNAQARDHISRANNAHQPADTIDLHGLYVAEAEEILGKRIGAATGRGDERLCVIVGKGIHSVGNVTKIKPAVEKLLAARGLKWEYEQGNEGVMVVNLEVVKQVEQSYQPEARNPEYNQQRPPPPRQQQPPPPRQQQPLPPRQQYPQYPQQQYPQQQQQQPLLQQYSQQRQPLLPQYSQPQQPLLPQYSQPQRPLLPQYSQPQQPLLPQYSQPQRPLQQQQQRPQQQYSGHRYSSSSSQAAEPSDGGCASAFLFVVCVIGLVFLGWKVL